MFFMMRKVYAGAQFNFYWVLQKSQHSGHAIISIPAIAASENFDGNTQAPKTSTLIWLKWGFILGVAGSVWSYLIWCQDTIADQPRQPKHNEILSK